jgi:two-component system sensor histidine kinase KdpD
VTGRERGLTIARWVGWFGALSVAAAALYAARTHLEKAHVALVFLLVVLGGSARGGRALGFALAGAAFVGFDVIFLQPYGRLFVEEPLDWLVLATFLITSAVSTQLLYRARAQTDQANERAAEVDRLAALGAETLSVARAEDALQAIADVIRTSVGVDACEIALRDTAGNLTVAARSGAPVAEGQGARMVDMPLVARGHDVGTLRVSSVGGVTLSREQARLLAALAYYAALGAERVRLVASAERAEAERRVEALRSALLTAVSHDLRTPLTTIRGIAHEISVGGDAHPSNAERATVIVDEADRMDALVGDLLDLSRIHAGAVVPSAEVNTADDLVGAALQRIAGVPGSLRVVTEMPGDVLLSGTFDLVHALRVLVNLLENALKYSPANAPVVLRVARDGAWLTFAVLDRGPGVEESERGRIFEPFYRPPGTPPDVRGTGLGLSIARGIAEALGGHVRYAARAEGGSEFTLLLPAAETPESV